MLYVHSNSELVKSFMKQIGKGVIMKREIGNKDFPIWLLGDSEPENWRHVLDALLIPAIPFATAYGLLFLISFKIKYIGKLVIESIHLQYIFAMRLVILPKNQIQIVLIGIKVSRMK